MEVNDSNEGKDEDVQLTDRGWYEPQETCIDRIGSYSLNPSSDTHYIDSSDDDSSVEDQPDGEIYSDESSMEDHPELENTKLVTIL